MTAYEKLLNKANTDLASRCWMYFSSLPPEVQRSVAVVYWLRNNKPAALQKRKKK